MIGSAHPAPLENKEILQLLKIVQDPGDRSHHLEASGGVALKVFQLCHYG